MSSRTATVNHRQRAKWQAVNGPVRVRFLTPEDAEAFKLRAPAPPTKRKRIRTDRQVLAEGMTELRRVLIRARAKFIQDALVLCEPTHHAQYRSARKKAKKAAQPFLDLIHALELDMEYFARTKQS